MNEFINKYKDHIFGELTVVGPEVLVLDREGNVTQRNVYCHCSCGKKWVIAGVNDLLNGNTTSCGCKGINTFIRVINSGNMGHGDSKGGIYKSLYISWTNMKYSLKYKIKQKISSENIAICPEWESYENFKEWSLKNDWSNQKTLKRKNYNEGFTPDNCYWSF